MVKHRIRSFLSYGKAIIRLVRLPNLLIVILTQFLVRYSLIGTFLFRGQPETMSGFADFIFLVLATILITAGGYVINDYFDMDIDLVNNTGLNRLGGKIPTRQVLMIYRVINGIGILAGFYLAYRIRSLTFGLIFPFITGLLWFYSLRYKRMFLLGNIVVSFLSAMVILVVWIFEFFHLRLDPMGFSQLYFNMRVIILLCGWYAVFAFLVSLAREIVKDMEDSEGDMLYGCRTLPLVSGFRTAKLVVMMIVVTILFLLGYGIVELYQLNFLITIYYSIVAIVIPFLYLLYKLYRAQEKAEYQGLSTLLKLIMLSGIFSMQILSINY
jgi:4-hydroxybenzoate polyprenyltransferase